MSYQFELALRQYIAAFEHSNEISQEEFKTRFENLNHKDFTFLAKDGTKLTNEEIYRRDLQTFSSGEAKVTLIHFRKIGLDCIDVKLGLIKDGEVERTVRAVTTISAGKAVKCKEIDESTESKIFLPRQLIEAKGANFVYKWQEFGTFQTNM